jgi:N-acetyl-anhydromuramyl-L-alanine amidase AmpD
MRKSTKYIVVHCSASRAKDVHVDVKEIDRWHRQKGWLMVGYHFVITRHAVVQVGRKLEDAGAHVYGHNKHSVGICLVGGVAENGKTPESNFTEEQMSALYVLLKEMRVLYPEAEIVGHFELEPAKTCPVFDIKTWLRERPELNAII